MSTKEEKKWYESKTKWAALLIGIGPVLATVGRLLNGSLDFAGALIQLSTELGVILAVFGVRDLPFINKK